MKYSEKALSIGVIIPVYNSAKWLRTCLDSVVSQTIPFTEIIIINDGSTDGSGVIAEEYASAYETVQVINQANSGAGSARNAGMDRIGTDYYLFLDSDDFLVEGTVEALKGIVENTHVDVVYFNGKSFMDDGADRRLYKGECRRRDSLTQNIITGREFFAQTYPGSYFPSPCFNLVKRDYIDHLGIRFCEDRSCYEDNSFAFFVIDRAERVKFIPDVLYMRRFREGSIMTSAMCVRKLKDLSGEYGRICRYFKEDKVIFKNMVCMLMLQNLMREVIYHIHFNHYEGDFMKDNTVFSFFEEYRGLRESVDVDECINQGLFITEKRIVCELKELLGNDYREYHLFDVDSKHARAHIDEFYKCVLKRFLFECPEKTIGIYGAGKHTEGIINLYNHYYGVPLANLYVVQTVKDMDGFMGYPVISADDMEKYPLDCVVVSSFKYHDEMKSTLAETSVSVEVVDIYDTVISDVFADYQIVFEQSNSERDDRRQREVKLSNVKLMENM